MTDPHLHDGLDPETFYDGLAPSYDTMTGFDARFARERPAFKRIVTGHNIRSAIDAGAGSGFHALLLAELGVRVTAVDISDKMLHLVRQHARDMDLRVDCLQGRFQDLARLIEGKVDGVFCLGNSLAHLTDDADLKEAIANFAAVLPPGGVLILQLLNYSRILASRDRIVGVQQRDDAIFIRLYDFLDPLLRFNILTLRQGSEGWKPELQSTMLRPLSSEDLQPHLRAAGFHPVSIYGGIAGEPYLPRGSRDLVVIAQKA